MMHWAQDFKRCSLVPVLDDINNADEFKEVLQVSAQRATLRKTDTDQVDTISKAADPGKFKDENKWPDWEPAFVNYLSPFQASRASHFPTWFAPMMHPTTKLISAMTSSAGRSLVPLYRVRHSELMPERYISYS